MKYTEDSNGIISVTPETEEEIKEYEAMFNEFQKICCDCDEPDEHPYFVRSLTIKCIGKVNHHGWACHKCHKYVQVG